MTLLKVEIVDALHIFQKNLNSLTYLCFIKISEFVSNQSYQELIDASRTFKPRVCAPRNIYGGESVFDDIPYRLLRGVIV